MRDSAALARNIPLFYVINFLVTLDFVIPIWVAFHLKFLDYTQIAFLTALLFGLATALELPTGALADLLGRKWTIAIGWIFQGLGHASIAFAFNFESFLAGYLIVAVGVALVSGANVAMAYDTFKELKREKDYSRFVAISSTFLRMGLAVGTFMGGYIYLIDFRLPYLLMGLTQISAVPLVILQIEPRIDSVKFTLHNYLQQTKDGFRETFKNSYIKKLTLFYTLIGGITWACAIYFNQPFAKDLDYNEIEQSWLFGSLYLITTFGIYLLSRSELFTKRSKVYLAFPIILSLCLIPGVWATKWMAPIILLGILFCVSGRFAFLDRYANLEFESRYRATAISALNMLVSLFVIIVVGLSGAIQDAYGTKVIFTGLGMVALLVALPVGVLLARHKKFEF